MCSCLSISGHVLYEMICSEELHALKPKKAQYQAISDPHLKEILQYVFSKESISQVYA